MLSTVRELKNSVSKQIYAEQSSKIIWLYQLGCKLATVTFRALALRQSEWRRAANARNVTFVNLTL